MHARYKRGFGRPGREAMDGSLVGRRSGVDIVDGKAIVRQNGRVYAFPNTLYNIV